MGQRIRETAVWLRVELPVEIETGVNLPAGDYRGTETCIGLPMMGGQVSWTKPEYKLELTADQIASFGGKYDPKLISTTYDVSKFIWRGDISVS